MKKLVLVLKLEPVKFPIPIHINEMTLDDILSACLDQQIAFQFTVKLIQKQILFQLTIWA